MKYKPKVVFVIVVALFIVVAITLWSDTIPFFLTKKTFSSSQRKLSTIKNQSLPQVKVIQPKRTTVSRTQTIPGDILPYQQAVLYAKVAGYLQEINYDIGDWVKKGEVIARIAIPEIKKQLHQDKAELNQWKAALKKAEAEYQLRELIFQRLARVQEQSIDMVSQEQVDEARGRWEIARGERELVKARIDAAKGKMGKTRVMVAYGKIRAPFDGVITQRWVDVGAMIQAVSSKSDVSPIVELMDVQRVRVQFYVPEPDVPFVQRGDRVVIQAAELSDKPFEGRVTRHAWALNIDTKSMLVEVELENPEGWLRPGMHLRVTIKLEEHPHAIVIPVKAIITEKKDNYIYAVNQQDIIKKIPIQLGIDDGFVVEIVGGLSGKEKVVIEEMERLTPGDHVQISLVKDR